MIESLDMKSIAPNLSDGLGKPSANAVLCTDDQTYQIRQVQSSNSVLVVQPSGNSPPSITDSVPSSSISAIAQCPITLELCLTSNSAAAYLKQSIPLHSESESKLALKSSEATSKYALLDNAPFSSGEFDKAWEELCCFELEGQAWLPIASVIVDLWRSVMSAATVRSVAIENAFSISALEGSVEEDGHPVAFFRAVIDRLSSEENDLMDGCECTLAPPSISEAKIPNGVILDRTKAVSWIGAAFLESQQAPPDGIFLPEFVREWQDLLPETWRQYADLQALKV